jgi:hypothetical protein
MANDQPHHLQIVAPDYSEAVVQELESLLAEARAGEIRGFTFMARTSGGCTLRSRVGELNYRDVVVNCEIMKADAIAQMFTDD